jgi:hypothetical protein
VWRKSVEEEMKILGEQMKEEPNVGRGEPTSGLEPLTPAQVDDQDNLRSS